MKLLTDFDEGPEYGKTWRRNLSVIDSQFSTALKGNLASLRGKFQAQSGNHNRDIIGQNNGAENTTKTMLEKDTSNKQECSSKKERSDQNCHKE